MVEMEKKRLDLKHIQKAEATMSGNSQRKGNVESSELLGFWLEQLAGGSGHQDRGRRGKLLNEEGRGERCSGLSLVWRFNDIGRGMIDLGSQAERRFGGHCDKA